MSEYTTESPGTQIVEGKEIPLPPKRRADESVEEFSARLDWFSKRLPDDLKNHRFTGYTATPDGLVHWTEAEMHGTSTVHTGGEAVDATLTGQRLNPKFGPQRFYVDAAFPTDTPRKRTDAEKLDHIVQMMWSLARQSYIGGYMHLPTSVARRLVTLGVYPSVDSITDASLEDVAKALETWAKALLNKAASNRLRAPEISTAPSQEGATQVA